MSSSAELRNAILAAEETFMANFKKGDAASIAALYTKEAQLMPPNSDFVNGPQAIQPMFQSFMDMGVKSMNLETVEVDGFGDTASEVGKYTLETADGTIVDKGKYIVLWKQETGKWKLHRDIFNSSMPAEK